jgi:diguanylate cyclase (GGDEF)-like protein
MDIHSNHWAENVMGNTEFLRSSGRSVALQERRAGFGALPALSRHVFRKHPGNGHAPMKQIRHASLPKIGELDAGYLLASSLQALGVGVEIWDAQDHLVYYNEKCNQLWPHFHTPVHIGQSFEIITRANFGRRLYSAAVGREEVWLAQQMALRSALPTPQLIELEGDVWIKSTNTRTPNGYLIVIQSDVTDLVRKGRALEATNHGLAQLSATDWLTGLPNRRYFEDVLSTEWQRAARSCTSLSLLVVDIDHFKRYNDHYGHPAGDGCLRRVAHVLGACVRRAGELVARYGGEEFVLLLPGSDMEHACEVAQACIEQMQAQAMPHPTSPSQGYVTLSIGVACTHPDPNTDPCAMVNAADAAMYRVKSNGRMHYQVADEADWDIDPDTPRTTPAALGAN